MNIISLLVAFVEWFDTAICIAFSDILFKFFFPNTTTIYGFSLSLALISISSIGKPLGALLFGIYSDSYSRIKASNLSFLIMIICSFILIFLPSYNTIGKFSTILFFLIKFIQGIAIGGNCGTSIYSIEQSDRKYFTSSLTSVAIFIGFLSAHLFNAGCIYWFSLEFNYYYAWKLGFLLTTLFSIPVIILFNKECNEDLKQQNNDLLQTKKDDFSNENTPTVKKFNFNNILKFGKLFRNLFYQYDTDNQQHKIPLLSYLFNLISAAINFDAKGTLLGFLTSDQEPENLNNQDKTKLWIIKSLIKSSILCLFEIIPFQYFHIFLPNYKIFILQLDHNTVRIGTFITLGMILVITPIVGYIADKKGPGFFLKTSALMMFFSYWITNYTIMSQYYLTDLYFGIMMGLCYGTLYCYLPMKFDQTNRAKITGLALNCSSFIVLIFMPMFTSFIENNILSILSILGFICLNIFNSDKTLNQFKQNDEI